MDPSEGTTGTRDEHFDLISVLYHALQGADACGRYAADAEAAGNERLAAFFGEAQASQRSLAGRAKGMLGIGAAGAVADTAGTGDVPPRSADVQREPDVSAEEVDTTTETTGTGGAPPPTLDVPPAPPSSVARPDEDLLAETRGAPPEDAPLDAPPTEEAPAAGGSPSRSGRERREAAGQTEGERGGRKGPSGQGEGRADGPGRGG